MDELGHSVRMTTSEQRVLEHVLRGESNREIAEQLSCSVKTVEFHLSNIFRKEGVNSRLQLLVRFVESSRIQDEA